MENITVVITDDKEVWRKTIRERIAEFGIQTIGEAQNGLELLDLLKNISPDVLLLDLKMPLMDGNKTMEVLRQQYPHLKIIVTTMFDEPTVLADYRARGACGGFSKIAAAANMSDYADAIKKIHRGGKHGTHFAFAQSEVIEFTQRQKDIIQLISEGFTDAVIAKKLQISASAVEKQKKNIKRILKVKSSGELLSHIYDNGFNFFSVPGSENTDREEC